jgi:hypothetical protein
LNNNYFEKKHGLAIKESIAFVYVTLYRFGMPYFDFPLKNAFQKPLFRGKSN